MQETTRDRGNPHDAAPNYFRALETINTIDHVPGPLDREAWALIERMCKQQPLTTHYEDARRLLAARQIAWKRGSKLVCGEQS
jgi:hypothetical protein